ncbi:TPA: hypothetical protein ACSW2U_001470 [Enterobacter roggenkampii]
MNVKRYEWVACDEHVCHCDVVESAEGDMVDYEDYAALEARCAALAAENARVKEEISNITFMRDDDFFGSTQRAQEVMGRLVNIKTPTTDAFLAEVRAQGVEMFASKCKEESKRAHSSDARDSWWVSGENADDFASQLRKGV